MILCAAVAMAEKPSYPSLAELLDGVLAQMPRDEVLILGKLTVRDKSQKTIRVVGVDIRTHIGTASASGSYTLHDAFGAPLEQFTVSRLRGRNAVYQYAKGNPLRPAPVPDIFASVQETGVSWSDLTFPFLWWRDGKVTGEASVKGRDCYVAEVRPPPQEPGHAGTMTLWIDRKYRMLIRAEECGADGQVLRRMTAQSFKKINDEWMIKDIVLENFALGYRSTLTIEEMSTAAAASR